jgi:endonuclease/exonuclease/phosphatase family metal-dependent hydrolase
MSLNVLHDFPRFEHLSERMDLIAKEIRRLDPDVVGLQEVPWTVGLGNAAEWLAVRTGMNHVYLRANGNRWAILFEEGEAILSRYPLKDISYVELKPQAGPFEHRVALQATAATPWGDVRVVVTHLTDGEPQVNRAQAARLVAFVGASEEAPIVVAGDFNAPPESPQIQAMVGEWIDTYRAARPEDEGYTCCVGALTQGPSQVLEKRIDYIFLVPGAEGARVVSSQRVLSQPFRLGDGWLWASDHVGVLSVIQVGR